MPSFGSGFSRGFVASSRNRLAREQLAEQQRQGVAKNLAAKVKASRDQTEKAFQDFVTFASEAAAVAEPGDPRLQQIQQGAVTLLMGHATLLEELRQQAIRENPELADAIPSGERFIRSRIPLLEAAIQTATIQRDALPEEVRDVEAIAEALGQPTEDVARARGLIPKDTTAADLLALEKRLDERRQNELKTESGLRKEVNALIKDFITVADAFAKINAAGSNPSAAGDLSLIFNYMKMLDPGSTVREGEFANAQNSGSAFQQVGGLYNRIVSGERLTQTQRADFLDRAADIMQASQTEAQKTADAYERISRNAGVDPDNVLATFEERSGPVEARKPQPSAAAINHLRENPDLIDEFIEKFGKDAVPSDL